jgi:hypothetical protein
MTIQVQVAFTDHSHTAAHLVTCMPAPSTLCGMWVMSYGPPLPTRKADWAAQPSPWCPRCVSDYEIHVAT